MAIQFVDYDFDTALAKLQGYWTDLGGGELADADPVNLLIRFAATIMAQQSYLMNWTALQNIADYAEGEYLDALCSVFWLVTRLEAEAATTTMQFSSQQALASAQLIPAGTRIRSTDQTVIFATEEDCYIPKGSSSVTVSAACTETGEIGNGYEAGTITNLIDVFPYYYSCTNLTTSEGGSDEETDEALRERMRESEEAYTTAGSKGSYEYWAKTANSSIASAKAVSPQPDWVYIYVLLEGGELPGEELLAEVEEICSADTVRPLNDVVKAMAPTTVSYDIEFTWYCTEDDDATAIAEAVAAAVETYKSWQCAEMGRCVNPTKLVGLLYQAGCSRVDITSPAHTEVSETEVAVIGSESVSWGGYCE